MVIWGLLRVELEKFEGEERLVSLLFGEEGEAGEEDRDTLEGNEDGTGRRI